MNILITGIHGFVGSNLVAALREQNILYGLDIIAPPTNGVRKTFGWNELDSIPPVDLIIHLAGKAHDTKNTFPTQEYMDINVGLTKIIFYHFLNSSATKFIYFSSVKAVADSVKTEILREDVLPNPHTPYGKSKLEAERYILSQAIPEGKKIYILRPCMIHGPGNKGNLNLLYKFVKTGLPYPLGAFNNKRSFTSIANLNFILEQIIEKEIPAGIYNVADDEPISTNELIAMFSSSLGKNTRVLRINRKIVKQTAVLGDILHLPFNSENLRKLTENYIVSNSKLVEVLGTSLPVSSREGLLTTLISFSSKII